MTLGGKEGRETEWLFCLQICKRREHMQVVADTEQEVSVTHIPEVLGVIVHAPGCTGQNSSRGKLEEKRVNISVVVTWRAVGEALEQPPDSEGHEEMLVVNIMQREVGCAGETELLRKLLEAERLKGDAQDRLRAARDAWERRSKKTQGYRQETEEAWPMTARDKGSGNHHGATRVNLLCHRRASAAKSLPCPKTCVWCKARLW